MDVMLYGHLPAMFSPYGCCCETNSLGRGCVVIDDKNKKSNYGGSCFCASRWA